MFPLFRPSVAPTHIDVNQQIFRLQQKSIGLSMKKKNDMIASAIHHFAVSFLSNSANTW